MEARSRLTCSQDSWWLYLPQLNSPSSGAAGLFSWLWLNSFFSVVFTESSAHIYYSTNKVTAVLFYWKPQMYQTSHQRLCIYWNPFNNLKRRYYYSHFTYLKFQGLRMLARNHSAMKRQSLNLNGGLSGSKVIFLSSYLIPCLSPWGCEHFLGQTLHLTYFCVLIAFSGAWATSDAQEIVLV